MLVHDVHVNAFFEINCTSIFRTYLFEVVVLKVDPVLNAHKVQKGIQYIFPALIDVMDECA